MRLILASSSLYRQQLLSRLRVPFTAISPDVDETAQPGESARDLAARLAAVKAHTVGRHHPRAVVIGSDQVATIDGAALGKPGSLARAQAQLERLSGQTVEFHTALCVSGPGRHEVANVVTTCCFRTLSRQEIDAYLSLEQPFDVAGSAKAEGLGISLMDSMRSDDPTAIIGLPLISLARMLRSFGLDSLGCAEAS